MYCQDVSFHQTMYQQGLQADRSTEIYLHLDTIVNVMTYLHGSLTENVNSHDDVGVVFTNLSCPHLTFYTGKGQKQQDRKKAMSVTKRPTTAEFVQLKFRDSACCFTFIRDFVNRNVRHLKR